MNKVVTSFLLFYFFVSFLALLLSSVPTLTSITTISCDQLSTTSMNHQPCHPSPHSDLHLWSNLNTSISDLDTIFDFLPDLLQPIIQSAQTHHQIIPNPPWGPPQPITEKQSTLISRCQKHPTTILKLVATIELKSHLPSFRLSECYQKKSRNNSLQGKQKQEKKGKSFWRHHWSVAASIATYLRRYFSFLIPLLIGASSPLLHRWTVASLIVVSVFANEESNFDFQWLLFASVNNGLGGGCAGVVVAGLGGGRRWCYCDGGGAKMIKEIVCLNKGEVMEKVKSKRYLG